MGVYEDRIEFIFEEANGSRFAITRVVRAAVVNEEDQGILAPIAPYVPPIPIREDPPEHVFEGEAPPQLAKITWKRHLPFSDVPNQVRYLLRDGSVSSQLRNVTADLFPKTFSVKTYCKRWTVLLWCEEIQAE